MNEVLRFITQRCCLCENSFDLHVQQTYGKQMSLFVTQGDSLRFHLLPQFYHPVPPPPPSLPSHLLPPSAVAFCQSAHPPGGEFDPSLFNSPSLLSPSLSPARSLCFLSAARSLSIRHSRTEAVSITYRQVQVQRWHSLTLLRPVTSTQWSRRSREGKGRKKKRVWWVTSLARRRRCQV